jgi:hypothetical protein
MPELPGADVAPSFGMLHELGELIAGPVVVVVSDSRQPAANATVVRWPIATDPTTLLAANGGDPLFSSGVRLEAPEDVAVLRSVRMQGWTAEWHAMDPTWVRTSDDRTYAAYIRDDVPEDLRAALLAAWEVEAR